MATLQTAFFADSVIVQDGKFFVWGGGIDRTYAPAFPMHTNFFLIAQISFEPTECGKPHKLEVNIVDEDGQPVGPSMPPQAFIPQRELDPTLSVRHNLVLGFQGLPFAKPAKIVFSIVVDGQVLGSLVYQAVQMTQAPAQGWHSKS